MNELSSIFPSSHSSMLGWVVFPFSALIQRMGLFLRVGPSLLLCLVITQQGKRVGDSSKDSTYTLSPVFLVALANLSFGFWGNELMQLSS